MPEETQLGPIPWRTLVLGLQVIGAFPYMVGKRDQRPRFNIPLFLWSIFISSFSVSGIFLVLRLGASVILTSEVGSRAFFYSASTTLVATSLSPVTLLISSKKLASFLADTGSDQQGIQSHARWKWSFLVPVLVLLGMFSFSIWYIVNTLKPDTALEGLFIFLVMSIVSLNFLLTLDLLEKTTSVLSQQLVTASNFTDVLARTKKNYTINEDSSKQFISALQAFKYTAWKVSCVESG